MNSGIQVIKPLGFPWETQDPFLFCVHHKDFYPKGNDKLGPPMESLKGRTIGNDFVIKDGWRMYHGQSIPGFPAHPHRGFETISIAKEGFIDHADSLGAAGRFGNGDVQWMTAGKGVMHSEMFPLIYQEQENTMEMFQVWLNLPKAKKFVAPHFKMLWNEEIPLLSFKDDNGFLTSVKLISGELNGCVSPQPTPDSWAANKNNEVSIFTIEMDVNASWELPMTTSEEVNRSLYFFEGDNIDLNEESLEDGYLAVLDGTKKMLIKNSGKTIAKILVLQGKPIDEPVVQYGPFVMNTQEEVQNAMDDFQHTKFGGWPWGSVGQTHGVEPVRFAKYPDGTLIKKEI